MPSVHAGTCALAFEQMSLMIRETGAGGLVLGQRVLDVVAELVVAAVAVALAGAAGAVAAVERDVDAEAVGGVGDGLAVPRIDEARDAVLEVERDAVCHGIAKTWP